METAATGAVTEAETQSRNPRQEKVPFNRKKPGGRTRLTRRTHPAEKWLGKGGEEEEDRTERMKEKEIQRKKTSRKHKIIQSKLM